MHSENADWVVADLMNCIDGGDIDSNSISHEKFRDAINTYLIERGYEENQLPDLWSGELQLTSS